MATVDLAVLSLAMRAYFETLDHTRRQEYFLTDRALAYMELMTFLAWLRGEERPQRS